jgi:hypothetical protein
MDSKRLCESPFTDVNPRAPEGVFSSVQLDQLVAVFSGDSGTSDGVTARNRLRVAFRSSGTRWPDLTMK